MDYSQGFMFTNNSTRDVIVSFGADKYGVSLYPDTTIIYGGSFYEQGKRFFFTYSTAKEDLWGATDTFCVFIFDADTFNTYGWNGIKEGYKILQRYDLSKMDMKKLKWSLVYPHTEAMKDMKMYPPYGE